MASFGSDDYKYENFMARYKMSSNVAFSRESWPIWPFCDQCTASFENDGNVNLNISLQQLSVNDFDLHGFLHVQMPLPVPSQVPSLDYHYGQNQIQKYNIFDVDELKETMENQRTQTRKSNRTIVSTCPSDDWMKLYCCYKLQVKWCQCHNENNFCQYSLEGAKPNNTMVSDDHIVSPYLQQKLHHICSKIHANRKRTLLSNQQMMSTVPIEDPRGLVFAAMSLLEYNAKTYEMNGDEQIDWCETDVCIQLWESELYQQQLQNHYKIFSRFRNAWMKWDDIALHVSTKSAFATAITG